MITVNLDITDGLVNGACGVLKYIKFQNDAPEILFFEFPSNVGIKAKSEFNHTMKDEKDFCMDWVPIKKTTMECYSTDGNVRIFREQYPLVPAEAMTVHKSQGQTYVSAVIDLSIGRVTRPLAYVALSRVTKLEDLYIIGKFKPPNPPKDTDPVRAELEELKTKKRLDICFNTLEESTGKICAYHNIRSLNKYLNHIQNDTWYSKCDVLMLAETQTISTDRPKLSGFRLVDRFDDFRKRGPRGVLVFSKNDMYMKKMKVSIEKSQSHEKSYHSTVFLFDCTSFYLLSGYKSPLTPAPMFEHQLSEIKTEKNLILMGDFNFDTANAQNSLNNIMRKNKMKCHLEPSDFTTKENTQIDVIYTKYNNVMCGTYESYFSDHRPIFCVFNGRKKTEVGKIELKDLQIKLDNLDILKKTSAPILSDDEINESKLLPKSPQKPMQRPQIQPSTSKRSSNVRVQLREKKEKIQKKPRPSNSKGKRQLRSSIIPLSGEQFSVADAIRARQASVAANFRQRCTEIRTPRFYLEDIHVDVFMSMVNRNTAFDMITVLAMQSDWSLEHYERPPEEAHLDDVQILFEGLAGPQNLGHFICIHYRSEERKIYVYDSLYWQRISQNSLNILDIRYPGYSKPLQFVKPKTKQPDGISCGVFASAYATTIILNENPAEYRLLLGSDRDYDTTLFLREHLADMLERNELSLFPRGPVGMNQKVVILLYILTAYFITQFFS